MKELRSTANSILRLAALLAVVLRLQLRHHPPGRLPLSGVCTVLPTCTQSLDVESKAGDAKITHLQGRVRLLRKGTHDAGAAVCCWCVGQRPSTNPIKGGH